MQKMVIIRFKNHFILTGAFSGPINYYRAAFSIMKTSQQKIEVPTLIVWGDPDMALNTELAELARQYVTNLTVKIIKNSNHFVIFDTPKECNAAIHEFLDKQ